MAELELDQDSDGDGVPNVIEFVVGGESVLQLPPAVAGPPPA
jgi:hypothetical protein